MSDKRESTVAFALEGKSGEQWREIERRCDIAIAERDEQNYRSFMSETGWRDFRIVRIETTRKVLKVQRRPLNYERFST